jgi:hypothetical protein
MSSDNIFKTINRVHYRVNSSNMFKDRSSPYSRPYNKPKKKEDLQPNGLLDTDNSEIDTISGLKSFIDKLILFVLTLFGKQTEWKETRAKLQALQKRIQTFEEIITSSKGQTSVSANIKQYKV